MYFPPAPCHSAATLQQHCLPRPLHITPAPARRSNSQPVRPCLKLGAPQRRTAAAPRVVCFSADIERVRWFYKAEPPTQTASANDDDDDHDDDKPALPLQLTPIRAPAPVHPASASVSLATASLAGDALCGTIDVHNLAFEKDVFVRMTADEWRTYTDIPATYSSSSSIATTGFDHFSFALPVVDAVPEVCVALCVCYRVGGCEYWDNNGGANYLFRLSRPAMPPPAAAAPPAATHTLSPPPTTAPSSATKRYMRYSEAQFSAAIYDGAPLPPPSHWSSSYLFGSAQLSDLYRAHSPLAASHAWPSLSATPLHC